MRTLGEFESQIFPMIRDTTGGTVTQTNIQESLNRCISYMVNEHGMYASKNRSDISVFPTVYEYPLPSDFHDIINIQTPVTQGRDYRKTTPREFYARFQDIDDVMAIDTIKGTRFLLLKDASIGASQVMNDCDSLTASGTWAVEASTDSANLTADSTNKKVGSASLNFDITVAQSGQNYGAIQNSTMTARDLTSYQNLGTFFVWVYIPTITNLTSFTLRWGSDTSNYYEGTVTAQHNGLAFRAGWNRLGFAWSGATTTGSPSVTAIDTLYFRVTYSASYANATDFRIDDIRVENPELMEIHYYSSSFVQNGSTSVFQQIFTQSSDQSLLADEDDDVMFYWALSDAHRILGNFEESSAALAAFNDFLKRIEGRYQSERKKEITNYYY